MQLSRQVAIARIEERMISNDLKQAVLVALKLDDWEFTDETIAAQVPGWDSLSHVNVILTVEKKFGVRFKSLEVLKLKNVGDLQRLLDLKLGRTS
jgi:acyl carrier protein